MIYCERHQLKQDLLSCRVEPLGETHGVCGTLDKVTVVVKNGLVPWRVGAAAGCTALHVLQHPLSRWLPPLAPHRVYLVLQLVFYVSFHAEKVKKLQMGNFMSLSPGRVQIACGDLRREGQQGLGRTVVWVSIVVVLLYPTP